MDAWRRNRDKSLIKHECLRFEELPKPGTLVAIDAEFVSMQQVGSHSTRLVCPVKRVFLFHRKKQSTDPTARTVSFDLLATVLHVSRSCEGMVRKKASHSLTTTSIRVKSSSIISPSSRASNVCSLLPPSASLTRALVVGDLDPHLSRHTLTPLKLVYKKLRLLVDRGCIFIGHGLSKDFRIISQCLASIWGSKVHRSIRQIFLSRPIK